MTDSPEDRAAALFPTAFGETLTPDQIRFRERIAQAIRQAEDAAYDRAADVVSCASAKQAIHALKRG